MTYFSILMFCLLTGTLYAQDSFVQTGQSIVLPFELTVAMLESGHAFTEISAITAESAQARGIAGREILQDELVLFHADLEQGLVRNVQDIRQVAIKELFMEIDSNEELMRKINLDIKDGLRLEKISTYVTVALLRN